MTATAPAGRVSVSLSVVASLSTCRSRADEMAKPFKYETKTLIELIKNKPCIWDKTLEVFKDRTTKQNAWDDICAELEEDFFNKDKREQRKISELVAGKWQNIRDAFVKSLKKQYTHPNMKRYLYHDRLQFLLKVIQRDEEEMTIYLPAKDEGHGERKEDTDSWKGDDAYSPRKKPRLQEDLDQEILQALRSTKAAPDEDEAFFISITPSVRKMCSEDKLEFRMGVLQLIKNINNRGKDLPDSGFFSSSSSSHAASSYSQYPNANADSDSFSQDTQLFKCE